MEILWLVLLALICYLLGSIPFSYLVGKIYGKNLFEVGSGNIGAMNIWRATKRLESLIMAMAGDMGKGILAVLIACWLAFLGYSLSVGIAVAAFFVILGHNYPFTLKFKGGKGLASMAGVLVVLSWPSLLIALGVIVASIVFAEIFLKKKINLSGDSKKKFKSILSVLGSQTVGRMVGIALALVTICFFNSDLLFLILPAGILILVKHRNIWREPEVFRKV